VTRKGVKRLMWRLHALALAVTRTLA